MSSNFPSRLPQRGIPKPTGSKLPGVSRTPATTTSGTTLKRSTITTTTAPSASSATTTRTTTKSSVPPPPTTTSSSSTPNPTPPPPAPAVQNVALEENPDVVKPKPVVKTHESTKIVEPKATVEPVNVAPPNWVELEAKYKSDIEALTESAEMATIDKEIAEEKLDNCERELQELKDKLNEASIQIEMFNREQQIEQPSGAGAAESTVTVLQLQKVEEQNELLKQAIVKLRDISTKDKAALEGLQLEHVELQEKFLDLEEKEQKYLEQIKIFQEQIDVSHSVQEMVEKLTQQKTSLEDQLKEKEEELDTMEKLRDLNDQIIENSRINEIELTGQLDLLRSQYNELNIKKRDIEDYLTDQERTLAKLKDENRILRDQVNGLKDQFKEGETIEQQKHQIENVAYKMKFSESRMAEKEAEIARYKRKLAEVEDQMNNLSLITKDYSAEIELLKQSNDTKSIEISELQKALKKKMEEVSELEIRKEMAEKKLQSLQRDSESKISNLTRTIETMKGVEVQHEEDMKRLMEDNEIIERERRELRDQLNKSNRSLERSMQAGNLSTSMMTAQDTSLASLGITLQATVPHQVSPVHQHHQQQQVTSTFAEPSHSLNLQSSSRSTSIADTPGPIKQMSVGSDMDDSILLSKLRDLSCAFDLVSRKNQELELELALNELNKRDPPYAGMSQVSEYYDVDRVKVLQMEMRKLKREIRAAMINQQICPKSRKINSVIQSERFTNSQLAIRYQALENEVSALMSSSTLTRLRPPMAPMQSTPVK